MAVIPLLKNKSSVSNTEGRLIPRKVQFDWAETPLEWIPGQPFASHFINEINMILPAGEFWFCRLYNKALPYVTDDKLRDDIQMFIRQEAMHARAHGGAIAEYLKAHGIETERNTKIMEWLFEDLLADNPLGIKTPKLLEKRWLVFRLGIIAAVEHMTCVLGNYALDNKNGMRWVPIPCCLIYCVGMVLKRSSTAAWRLICINTLAAVMFRVITCRP